LRRDHRPERARHRHHATLQLADDSLGVGILAEEMELVDERERRHRAGYDLLVDGLDLGIRLGTAIVNGLDVIADSAAGHRPDAHQGAGPRLALAAAAR
jgi:hypothetical protein